MPKSVRALIQIFIGVPGALIWAGGLLCGIGLFIKAFGGGLNRIDPAEMAAIAAMALATLVGFAMVMSTEIVTSGRRYRIEARRLIPCAGLEFGAQLFAVVAAGTIIAAFMQFGKGEPVLALLLGFIGLLMVAGASWVAVRANALRKRWKAEYRRMREDTPWD